MYDPSTVTAHIESHSEIESWWVSVPGHPTRCVGHEYDTTRDEAIERGIQCAENDDAWDVVEAKIRAEFPNRQLYKGTFGRGNDIDWTGFLPNTEYIYVLKDRRRHGKYQIAAAYTI